MEARLRLAGSVLIDVLYVVATDKRAPCCPDVEAIERGLRSIAYYLPSNDAIEVASAAILEASGNERSQLTVEGW